MTKPAKVKPVMGWAVIVDGKIDLSSVYETRGFAVLIRTRLAELGRCVGAGPIRVETRPVAAKRKAK